jgi:TPR repeat protein
MASREFLKTMKEARSGDVFSQQKLGEIYLYGEFNTPKQSANALIWLEKAYQGYQSQGLLENLDLVLGSILKLNLAETLTSPAVDFAWQSFIEAANNGDLNAQWQIGKTLIAIDESDSNYSLIVEIFSRILPNSDFRELAINYLENVSKTNTGISEEAAILLDDKRPLPEKMELFWSQWVTSRNRDALQAAAELGYAPAQLALGLQLAKLDATTSSSDQQDRADKSDADSSGASLKKAVQWLTLAAKQGDRNAWYNLALIYRRPQFSGYNAEESDRCFDQAADLGHPQSQFRKGSLLWRKRARLSESASTEIPELKASYWIWQAAQQQVPEAIDLLPKILSRKPDPKSNEWHELALMAKLALDKGSQIRLPADWVPLCHRIIVGNQFSLSKTEMLLVNISEMQHEHCVVVDIRESVPKAHYRLIQIDTLEQRKSLLLASKIFSSDIYDQDHLNLIDEGNLRQRRYRFDKLSEWLKENFS